LLRIKLKGKSFATGIPQQRIALIAMRAGHNSGAIRLNIDNVHSRCAIVVGTVKACQIHKGLSEHFARSSPILSLLRDLGVGFFATVKGRYAVWRNGQEDMRLVVSIEIHGYLISTDQVVGRAETTNIV
jgi:hypothetical protein